MPGSARGNCRRTDVGHKLPQGFEGYSWAWALKARAANKKWAAEIYGGKRSAAVNVEVTSYLLSTYCRLKTTDHTPFLLSCCDG